ncbi:Sec63 [Ascosphaera acerosa]|nr:Sec63 [Ascosphaera acerosa]
MSISFTTAKSLARLWAGQPRDQRTWSEPASNVHVVDRELQVEQNFLNNHIRIICCTSTLATGINLPCHLVIIKNTVSWQDNGFKPYSDLDVIQMLGRAGRPQFDDTAVAVILTRKSHQEYYEKLVAGSEPLESCLHTNLIEHLNAEVGLGTVNDVRSALDWLKKTFFFVRLRRNPTYYHLEEQADTCAKDALLTKLCERSLEALSQAGLISSQDCIRPTEFGQIMARYYIRFNTMSSILSVPAKATTGEIVSLREANEAVGFVTNGTQLMALATAEEFQDIRLKAGEKSLFKALNKDTAIRYSIKIDIGTTAHKVSLLIQSELGAVDLPTGDQYNNHRLTFQQDKIMVFNHANRLARCLVDCSIAREDATLAEHALELAQSLNARAWCNSPLQLKQIEGIGIMSVRKLASGGIKTIEDLASSDAQRVDMLLSKNPPFGTRLVAKAAAFPQVMVSLHVLKKVRT